MIVADDAIRAVRPVQLRGDAAALTFHRGAATAGIGLDGAGALVLDAPGGLGVRGGVSADVVSAGAVSGDTVRVGGITLSAEINDGWWPLVATRDTVSVVIAIGTR
ncbi:MAG: hypothetical protein ACT4RN_17830 [Pseudonocardia sp.]